MQLPDLHIVSHLVSKLLQIILQIFTIGRAEALSHLFGVNP